MRREIYGVWELVVQRVQGWVSEHAQAVRGHLLLIA